MGISKGHTHSYSYQKHRQVLSSSKASYNNFNENLAFDAWQYKSLRFAWQIQMFIKNLRTNVVGVIVK